MLVHCSIIEYLHWYMYLLHVHILMRICMCITAEILDEIIKAGFQKPTPIQVLENVCHFEENTCTIVYMCIHSHVSVHITCGPFSVPVMAHSSTRI